MEIFLNLLDELDDLVATTRHLVVSTASEVASLSAPVTTAITAVASALWMLFSARH